MGGRGAANERGDSVTDVLRRLLAADPFEPFVIAVTGLDNEFTVSDPRQLSIPPVFGKTVTFKTGGKGRVVIAVRHITTVTVVAPEGFA